MFFTSKKDKKIKALEKEIERLKRVIASKERFKGSYGRLDILEMPLVNDTALALTKQYNWNYRKCPHALICGITGGGKTALLVYMIRSLLKAKATISIIDPKKSDLSYLEKYFGDKVVCENHNIVTLMGQSVVMMNKRFEEFKARNDYAFGQDYHSYQYKPHFLFFDEVMAFFGGSADNKDKLLCKKYLLDIIAKGRQAGVFVIITTQRADTKFIDGAIRDQLGLRISLGKLSNDGYKMTFGRQDLTLSSNTIGAGFIYIDGLKWDRPRDFLSPYIPQSYDFIKDIENLVGILEVDPLPEEIKTINLSDIKSLKELNIKKKSLKKN